MSNEGTQIQPGMPGYNPHFAPRDPVGPAGFTPEDVAVWNAQAAPTVAEPALLNANALSPEGLMAYLQTRFGALDTRIDDIMQRQQHNEKVRVQLAELQKTLSSLNEHPDDPLQGHDMPVGPNGVSLRDEIHAKINAIEAVDPALGQRIRDDLTQSGQILSDNNFRYNGSEVTHTKEYLQGLSKQLETGAQLDMIQLQSLMSARQTAVSLATNMLASYNDSEKAIVGNIR